MPNCNYNEVELWGGCYNVEYNHQIHLGNSGLTGPIPPEIGQLTNLTELLLFNNQLTGEIPSEIGQLTNLNVLYLDTNQLSGEIPSEICNSNINYIQLQYNNLCPPYPDCLTEEDIGIQECNMISPGLLPPRQLGRRRPGTGPYTPGRGRRGASTKSGMRRGYNKGGGVNTNSRFSGRSQSNPKGKSKK